MQEILKSSYQDGGMIDIVCTGFDKAAVEAAAVLEGAGYVPGSENWPLITGLGCGEEAVEAMNQGRLYCSVYMDEKKLVDSCVKMAEACVKGEEVEINDKVQYDNGVKIVEANVCEAKLYTAENLDKLNGMEEEISVEEKEVKEEDEALDSMSVEDF